MARKRKKEEPGANVEGLPRPESVIERKTFISPKGRKYLILKTTERDATDEPPPTGKGRKSG
jgi:hypothetical protein